MSRIHGILKAQKKRSMTEPGVEPWIPKLHIRDQIVVNDRYRALWNKVHKILPSVQQFAIFTAF